MYNKVFISKNCGQDSFKIFARRDVVTSIAIQH